MYKQMYMYTHLYANVFIHVYILMCKKMYVIYYKYIKNLCVTYIFDWFLVKDQLREKFI